MNVLPALDLGVADYELVQRLQGRIRHLVARGACDGVLLLLEHPPVITLGSRGSPSDINPHALPRDLPPVVKSERGGAVTLHAPGQLISYPIVPIPGRSLHRYVNCLEDVLLELLRDWGIVAAREDQRPGVYVGGFKIASLGLRCQRWVASHGTSLNVTVDLGLFDLIVSCGDPDLRQASMEVVTGTRPEMAEVKQRYRVHFQRVFSRPLLPLRNEPIEAVEELLGMGPRWTLR